MSSQVNTSVFPCLDRSANRVVLVSNVVGKRPSRSPLVNFSKMWLWSIPMVYFVSSVEIEIKYVCSLNNAQHNRLYKQILLLLLCWKLHAVGHSHCERISWNPRMGIYPKPIFGERTSVTDKSISAIIFITVFYSWFPSSSTIWLWKLNTLSVLPSHASGFVFWIPGSDLGNVYKVTRHPFMKTFRYFFVPLYSTLSLVCRPPGNVILSIDYAQLRLLLLAVNEDLLVIFQLWRRCLVLKRISWMDT